MVNAAGLARHLCLHLSATCLSRGTSDFGTRAVRTLMPRSSRCAPKPMCHVIKRPQTSRLPSSALCGLQRQCAMCTYCQPEHMLCVTAALRQRFEGSGGRQAATVGPTLRAAGLHPACRPVHEVTNTECLVLVIDAMCVQHTVVPAALAYSWRAGGPCILRSSTAHRNVYRGTANMFSQDAVALELVDKLLVKSTCMPPPMSPMFEQMVFSCTSRGVHSASCELSC